MILICKLGFSMVTVTDLTQAEYLVHYLYRLICIIIFIIKIGKQFLDPDITTNNVK